MLSISHRPQNVPADDKHLIYCSGNCPQNWPQSEVSEVSGIQSHRLRHPGLAAWISG